MGLDMYLFKTKKVEGLTGDEYNKVANCVYHNEEDLKNSTNAILEIIEAILP